MQETELLLLDCLKTAKVGESEPEAAREALAWIQRQADQLDKEKEERRPQLLELTATGELLPAEVLEILDAIRWASKVSHHLWRIQNYLYPVDEEKSG